MPSDRKIKNKVSSSVKKYYSNEKSEIHKENNLIGSFYIWPRFGFPIFKTTCSFSINKDYIKINVPRFFDLFGFYKREYILKKTQIVNIHDKFLRLVTFFAKEVGARSLNIYYKERGQVNLYIIDTNKIFGNKDIYEELKKFGYPFEHKK